MAPINLTYMTDRTPKAVLKKSHPDLYAYLSDTGAISPSHETVHYCGLVILDNNRSYIFLPRNSIEFEDQTDEQKLGVARTTMRTLTKFAKAADRKELGRAEGSGGTIAPIIEEIAKDFRDNGIYQERMREPSRNSGKPDWKKTIIKERPYFSPSGTVYPDILTTKPVQSQDNPLALIQQAVVSEIKEGHGWWLQESLGTRRLPDALPRLKQPRESWIPMLKRFMLSLYQERPLRLAHLLCDYLKAESENPQGSFFCGLRDFHTVWEAMLRNVIQNVQTGWAARLPFPNYLSIDGVLERTSGMLPDIVVETEEGLLVVDAKYYSATNTENSPKLGDILKQISYLHAVKTVEQTKKIETCFVFPRKDQTCGRYERVVFTSDNGTVPDVFPDIGCHYFPINRVMTEYVRNQKVPFSIFQQH